MKIIIIMSGYFPGKEYGGPPVSTDNFCSLMKEDECYIITRNHDLSNTFPYKGIRSNEWNKRSNCTVLYLNDRDYNKKRFKKEINKIKPDVMYLQSLFQDCIVPCLKIAKENQIPVVLAPRGELCMGAFKKKYKKIPYIMCLKSMGLLKNVVYQSTSAEESEAIKKYLKASKEDIYYLTNIPSIPNQKYSRQVKRSRKGNFIFLSRIHPKKNLLGAIKYFNGVVGEVNFDIYGPKEDESYWNECEKEIKNLPSNINVNYCGLIPHEKVHETFSLYDAFVFPTFSENYGHAIVESLTVGTPVIISDQTPWNDITEAGAGWAISLNNPEKFTEAIQEIVDSEGFKYQEHIFEYIQKKLQIDYLYRQYKDMLRKIGNKYIE